jgi:hypothetical protein
VMREDVLVQARMMGADALVNLSWELTEPTFIELFGPDTLIAFPWFSTVRVKALAVRFTDKPAASPASDGPPRPLTAP